jgi:hypothetical protein
MPDAEAIVPLGQSNSGFIAHQFAVVVGRRCNGQCTKKQNLSRRRFQKVGAAHDFADSHVCVIDNDGELISGHVVSPPHDKISEILSGGPHVRPEVPIRKTNLFSIWNAEPPIHARRLCKLGCIRAATAPARVDRLIVGIIGGTRRFGHVPTRTRAGIDKTAITQLLPRGQVKIPPLTLRVRPVWSPEIRTLGPFDAQPAEILQHGTHELRSASLEIQILIPQDQSPTLLFRALGSDPKCARVAAMQESGGRWRQAATVKVGNHNCILT